MTNLDKIKSRVKNAAFSDSDYASFLEDRGLVSTSTYNPSSDLRALDLTQADMCISMITFSDVSEGGYRISQSQKDLYQKIASCIFSKWGVSDPTTPTAKFISPW